MRFLYPIGFISLISIVILILIYLIKPTYEIKKISSTYIWEIAKKHYKKKDKNIFRDIIIFILEFLVLLFCTFLIAGGIIRKKSKVEKGNILILDASLNMNIKSGTSTRFDVAIEKIKDLTLKSDTPMTIIYAGSNPRNIVKNETDRGKIITSLTNLKPEFSYLDFDKLGLLYAENIKSMESANTYFYTGKNYQRIKKLNQINVSDKKEWNASIDNFFEEIKDGFCIFKAEISLFKAFTPLNIHLTVYDANNEGEVREAVKRVYLSSGEREEVTFNDLDIHTYSYAKLEIKTDTKVKDSFPFDDVYILTNGYKETLNVSYSSEKGNNFFLGSLYTLRGSFKDVFDINIEELHKEKDRKYKGFDLYIFEHFTPDRIPTDGVTLVVNPDKDLPEIGLLVKGYEEGRFKVQKESDSFLTSFIDEKKLSVSKYQVLNTPSNFKVLLKINDHPILLYDENKKIIILAIDLNHSNFPILKSFPLFIYNIFNTTLPSVTNKKEGFVGEDFLIRVRGKEVNISNEKGFNKIIKKDTKYNFLEPGLYKVRQILRSGDVEEVKIFIKTNPDESNIIKVENEPKMELLKSKDSKGFINIDLYIGISILLLLFILRILYSIKKL